MTGNDRAAALRAQILKLTEEYHRSNWGETTSSFLGSRTCRMAGVYSTKPNSNSSLTHRWTSG